MCGAKSYYEDESTLVARAQIAACGTVHERPRGQRQSGGNMAAFSGVLSLSAYAAAGVRNTWTLCGGSRC